MIISRGDTKMKYWEELDNDDSDGSDSDSDWMAERNKEKPVSNQEEENDQGSLREEVGGGGGEGDSLTPLSAAYTIMGSVKKGAVKEDGEMIMKKGAVKVEGELIIPGEDIQMEDVRERAKAGGDREMKKEPVGST